MCIRDRKGQLRVIRTCTFTYCADGPWCFRIRGIRVRYFSYSEVELMPKEQLLLTSESVTEGHPDKLADQISDGILDAILAQDPMGRVACETLVTTCLLYTSRCV